MVLHSLAVTGLEEYRVEKALYARGFPIAGEVGWSAIGDLATEVNIGEMSAVVDEANINDPEKLAGDITAVHDWSSKKLAYVAAAVAGGALTENVHVPAKQQADWADYLKKGWPHRLAAYGDAPDATSLMPAERRRKVVAKLVTMERDYLQALGFFYREYHGAEGFYRRKDEQLFDARWSRAVQAIVEQQAASDRPAAST